MRQLIAAILAWWCCSASALELVIATNEYPPYISADPEQSFITELFEHIGKDMGVTFTFRYMPWKRCIAALDQKQVWAVVPFVSTPERAERYLMSDKLYARKAKFFYHDGGARQWPAGYKNIGELKQFKIGGVAGYWYEAMFIEAGIAIDPAITDERNFTKLRAHRFDLAIADENVGNYIIRTQFSQQVERFHSLESPFYVSENVLMMNRGPAAAALLARFNRALEGVRKSGAYDAIVSRRKLVLMN